MTSDTRPDKGRTINKIVCFQAANRLIVNTSRALHNLLACS
ncbi:hypothetical protein BMETH_54_0 [methanotrophic bacterial endosymbiont of Bathymodiolus sp.]|nr:hypothetical protein BMETH_54_0 [methanotrophic bacterial endosymbiont of Bathymodiolus sp.]